MERIITHNPDDEAIWKEEEPRFKVQYDKPFKPFCEKDFEGRNLLSRDFYAGLSFTLEDFGVGAVYYLREYFLGYDPEWAKEHAATPFGPVAPSYQFRLKSDPDGVIIPPLELSVLLFGRTDRYPPDQLMAFPSIRRAILGRWEKRSVDPWLHPLPLVIPQMYLLPERREIRAVYLPDDPQILSDLEVTFLSTEPKISNIK